MYVMMLPRCCRLIYSAKIYSLFPHRSIPVKCYSSAALHEEKPLKQDSVEGLSKEQTTDDSGFSVDSTDEGNSNKKLKPPSSHESPSLLYDPLASKFINMLMRDGKKSQARRVFMDSLEIIKRTQIAKASSGSGEKVVYNPMIVFRQAIENTKPSVATRILKRGGKSYHIPCSVTEKRRTFLACKWIIMSARRKRGIGTAKKLAIDFIDSYNHQGYAIKKKQDLHRLADANRAYAHFSW